MKEYALYKLQECLSFPQIHWYCRAGLFLLFNIVAPFFVWAWWSDLSLPPKFSKQLMKGLGSEHGAPRFHSVVGTPEQYSRTSTVLCSASMHARNKELSIMTSGVYDPLWQNMLAFCVGIAFRACRQTVNVVHTFFVHLR